MEGWAAQAGTCLGMVMFPSLSPGSSSKVCCTKHSHSHPAKSHTPLPLARYTIGKERVFLEAARVLRQKVYVSATKLKVRRLALSGNGRGSAIKQV